MAVRMIVVPVSGSTRDLPALKTAFLLATTFSAHVQAVFVRFEPSEILPFGELPLSPDFAQELVDAASDVELVATNAARSTLAETAAACAVRLVGSVQKCDTASVSYREETGYLPQVLSRLARLCDVVVIPEIRGSDNHDMIDAVSRVLVKAGCPVLLTGSGTPPQALGKKVAIGWDNGVACARAMIASLPILHAAESVDVITVGDAPLAETGIGEALTYLSLQGIAAEGRVVARKARKVSCDIVDAAISFGCDLLVIGGYSRGHMTEAMFGGVTQDLVQSTHLPVFMLH